MISAAQEKNKIGSRSGRTTRVLFGFLAAVIFAPAAIYAFFHAGSFFSTPQHQPISSDLLVVLGGGLGERAYTGAELYRSGFAPRVLLTGIKEKGEVVENPDPFFRLPYLRFRGVPSEAMILDSEVDSTWEEAWLIRKLCLEHHWRTVLVVSDPPHFRRLSWSLTSAMAGTDIDWRLVPAQSPWWNAGTWWDNSRALEFVGKEVFKLAFYLFRYGAGLGTG